MENETVHVLVIGQFNKLQSSHGASIISQASFTYSEITHESKPKKPTAFGKRTEKISYSRICPEGP